MAFVGPDSVSRLRVGRSMMKRRREMRSSRLFAPSARHAWPTMAVLTMQAPLSDLHVYKVHFEAKHPKFPTPPELA